MANNLIKATSPYLLQHAHNPVDWYEWGEEALRLAKDFDRPILVSIGYSACHWCHVMERVYHKEASREMHERNINMMNDAVEQKLVWAEKGVKQYLKAS